ncbi:MULTISPECIES: hypothetical protein [Nostocales]|uniref:Uncharacterized protein n=2 Tax=Nostocales TaxID=1161 RepID=A0ABW8WXZ1_9CYAN|nr:hypothetical protein [Tolypothrix bouteillei]
MTVRYLSLETGFLCLKLPILSYVLNDKQTHAIATLFVTKR